MKDSKKKDIYALTNIIGEHIKKYWIMMIIILALICSFAIGFMIYWYVSSDIVSLKEEVAFYIVQGFLLLISLIYIVLLILNKKDIIKNTSIAILFHIYAFLLMAAGTLSFIFDLTLGFPEIIFLLIFTIIAGLFVVEPIFFSICASLSLLAMVITAIINPDMLFGGSLLIENIINIVAFVLAIITIAYRNYRVTSTEFKQAKRLEELSYLDELTGLLNERSYVNEVTSLDEDIKAGKEVNFAVILMDVNNLKNTNDKYGHRYGCSLVVKCGHTLPTLFKSSKLFHIGGDEFLAIVKGEDYDNFEEVMKKFDEVMLYSLFTYEGQELIFSVARGYAKYEKGQRYHDVMQIADKLMYENKAYLKEKYHMKGR